MVTREFRLGYAEGDGLTNEYFEDEQQKHRVSPKYV